MSNIGIRIKNRRTELGISVDELAAKLGKNRATVYRYENNDIENMPLDVIGPLAKALDVSPAYLMGWNDESKKASPEEWQEKFVSTVCSLIQGDIADVTAAGIDIEKVNKILDLGPAITLTQAFEVADELGLSLDEILRGETKKVTLVDDLDSKIAEIIVSLSPDKKAEAINYLKYLASTSGHEDNKVI